MLADDANILRQEIGLRRHVLQRDVGRVSTRHTRNLGGFALERSASDAISITKPRTLSAPSGFAARMPATSSVFLNVSSIEKSLEFYRNIGFRVAKSYKDDNGKVAWADLSLQGADLGLGHIASNDEPSFRQWVGTPLGAGVIIYFNVPNVDRYFKLAKDARATIEMPLTDRPYGRMFTLNDPDGYTITFIREPPASRKKAAKKAGAKKAPAKAKRVAAKKSAKKTAKRKAR